MAREARGKVPTSQVIWKVKSKTPACSQGGYTKKTYPGLVRMRNTLNSHTLLVGRSAPTTVENSKADFIFTLWLGNCIHTPNSNTNMPSSSRQCPHRTHPSTQHREVDTLKHSDIRTTTGREWPTTATAVTWSILLCWSKVLEWILNTWAQSYLLNKCKLKFWVTFFLL